MPWGCEAGRLPGALAMAGMPLLAVLLCREPAGLGSYWWHWPSVPPRMPWLGPYAGHYVLLYYQPSLVLWKCVLAGVAPCWPLVCEHSSSATLDVSISRWKRCTTFQPDTP